MLTDEITAHEAEDDPRNQHLLIYVDGKIVPRSEAKVSVYDSGFMLGDGVWEGLRFYNGTWAFLDEHINRLYEAAKAIDLDINLNEVELIAALEKTRLANRITKDAHARVMVTRGIKARPFQHPSLSLQGPTVVIIIEHSVPKFSRPIKLATVPNIRGLPMTQDPKLNSHSKLNCILACIAAQKAGADEALMLDVNGFVCTTNSCNFFIVRSGEVWTSTGDYCLNGITRSKVIYICQNNDINCIQKNFTFDDIKNCDEAFVTGTFAGVIPVSKIENKNLLSTKQDSLTNHIRTLYNKYLEENNK